MGVKRIIGEGKLDMGKDGRDGLCLLQATSYARLLTFDRREVFVLHPEAYR